MVLDENGWNRRFDQGLLGRDEFESDDECLQALNDRLDLIRYVEQQLDHRYSNKSFELKATPQTKWRLQIASRPVLTCLNFGLFPTSPMTTQLKLIQTELVQRLLRGMFERGRVVLGTTVLHGVTVIRVQSADCRTSKINMDHLLEDLDGSLRDLRSLSALTTPLVSKL